MTKCQLIEPPKFNWIDCPYFFPRLLVQSVKLTLILKFSMHVTFAALPNIKQKKINHFILNAVHIIKIYLNAEYLVRSELSSMFHWFVLILWPV